MISAPADDAVGPPLSDQSTMGNGNRGDNAKTNNLGPKNIIYEQIKKKSIRKEKKKRGKKR